jgi:hypothetical protein
MTIGKPITVLNDQQLLPGGNALCELLILTTKETFHLYK